jgi:phosphoglycerate dehydrogenase-like enzyme
MIKIAVLDDYHRAALKLADWSPLQGRADVTVFTSHLPDPEDVIARLAPFAAVCVMRERTPMPREVIERLPQLKLICSTGARNASIDMAAAEARGIEVAFTGYSSSPTIEMTWAVMLALARNLVGEVNAMRSGGWQQRVGIGLRGKTLGLLGLGRIGTEVARIAGMFGMHVIAWSTNLTPEAAREKGAVHVSKEDLFTHSDFLSIHSVLSGRSRGIVDAASIARMKPSAYLINTSRGPLVDEAALIDALRERRIAGAAVDVYDVEPLPTDHPFRVMDNVIPTPHIGYVTDDMYRVFYRDTVANLVKWLDRQAGS